MAGRTCIIGTGNPDRGDDAVGRAAAAQLRERALEPVEVIDHSGEVTGLLEWLEAADTAYLIDAAASGAVPGTIYRFDAHAGALPRSLFALSTHGFGPGEAVDLARAMGGLPRICVVYAVEGAAFEAGASLSAAVAAAADEVAERILAELGERTGSGEGSKRHA